MDSGVEVIVLVGISGAGKNHFIENNMPRPNLVVSADDYFMVDGKYQFDPKKLSAAHGSCFRNAVSFLKDYEGRKSTLVVNNTNSSIPEIAPYMAAAGAYGGHGHVIVLRIDPYLATARSQHGITTEANVKMAARVEETLKALPPWWDKEILQWDSKTSTYRFA